MSTLMTASEVCERALRMIGAYAINDAAARPADLKEALYWLDMMLADLAGKDVLSWLVPATIEIELTEEVGAYDLLTALGTNAPNGYLYPIEAMLEVSAGNLVPLPIITRRTFDTIVNPDEAGLPTQCHIDRLVTAPQMRLHPIPAADQTDLVVHLTIMTFPNDIATSGVTGRAGQGNVATGLRQTWNLWACEMLASYTGDGPVRRMPDARISRWRNSAEARMADLMGFENREHETQPDQTQFRDF